MGSFKWSRQMPASVDEVVASLKTSYPGAFADSGKSGGGVVGAVPEVVDQRQSLVRSTTL